MKSLDGRAADLLQGCEAIILSSISQEGYPRPVPLSKIILGGISKIWMAAGEHSVKTKDLRSNLKVGLCFCEQGDSVVLTGEVEAMTDARLRQKYWQDWSIVHFPEGPTDPEYVLLKLHSEHATFWIDGRFVHRNT